MPTFGELVTRISGDLNRGTEHSDRIKVAISNAIDFYAANRFGFNLGRSNTVTQSAVEYMTLPTDWVEADWLVLEENDTQRDILEEQSGEWIDGQSTNADDEGRPVAFAVQARSMRLWPIPDASYSLQLNYLRTLPEVSLSASDDASNAWTTEGYRLVYAHAMSDMLFYIGGEESIAKISPMQQLETQVLRELKRRASLEQGPGRIRPCL